MVLSDSAIRRLIEAGRIGIDPYEPALMQPSSLDVRVDRLFRVFRNSRYPYIDVKVEQEGMTELIEVEDDEPFILHPGEFVLGSTLERVTLPDDLVARLEGKSSLGRLGLLIHSTAGFIDPGWDGHVTLELSNVANLPITIYPGMKIGQLSFVQMSEPAETPYGSGTLGSKYQGQRGPTPSRYWKNFETAMILVTGAAGSSSGRHRHHACSPSAARACAGWCATPPGPPRSTTSTASSPGATSPTLPRCRRRWRASTPSCTSSRSSAGHAADFERVMTRGHGERARRGAGGRCTSVRAT